MPKRAREVAGRETPDQTGFWTAAPMRQAAAIFAAALAVRVLYLLSIHNAYFFDHPLTEAFRYRLWASAILDGVARARPPFDEAPAYPYFVAALFWLFGRKVVAVAVFQAVLDSASCATIALLGRRLAGARVGWIAGALAAAYGPLIYFCGELLPATLLVLFVGLAILTTPVSEDSTTRQWIVAGTLWGAAVLVRSEAVLALPVVFLHAYALRGRRALLPVAAVPAAILLASLSINLISSHRWVPLTTGSGVNLWLGNNPEADGVSPFIHGALAQVAQHVSLHAHNAVEADDLFRHYALEFWKEQTGRAAGLLLRKFLWTWTERELPNTSDIDWQTSQSWLFRAPVLPVRFGLLLPLGVAGALMLGRAWRSNLILAAPVVVALGTSVIFFTNARFRLVVCAAALPLAGLAIHRCALALPRWREHIPELRLFFLGLLIGVVAAWADFDGVRAYRLSEIDVNTGGLERAAGDFAGAVHFLQLGVDENPSDSRAWVELVLALEQSGRHEDAVQTWRRALTRLPEDPTLREMERFFRRHMAAPEGARSPF